MVNIKLSEFMRDIGGKRAAVIGVGISNIPLIKWLTKLNVKVTAFDRLPEEKFDTVILAVAHDAFKNIDIKSLVREEGVVYDVKGVLPRDLIDGRL